MIIYNMPYRAPFNYDKFVLNCLQLSNYLNYAIKQINQELDSPDNLIKLEAQIDNILNQATDISEEMFIETLSIKE